MVYGTIIKNTHLKNKAQKICLILSLTVIIGSITITKPNLQKIVS